MTLDGFVPVGRLVPRRLAVRLGPPLQQVVLATIQVVRGSAPTIEIPGDFDRVYLFHVRKTAGTSLVRSFLMLGGEDPAVVERRIAASVLSRTTSGWVTFATGIGALRQGDYDFDWSHAPAHRLHLPARTFTIGLLRDPAARVLSYYHYPCAGDRHDEVGWTVQLRERALQGADFADFLRNLPPGLLLNQLFMYSATHDVKEAVDRLLACQALIRIEHLTPDLSRLATRLGVDLAARSERITPEVKFVPTAGELDELHERLTPEYRMVELLRAQRPDLSLIPTSCADGSLGTAG